MVDKQLERDLYYLRIAKTISLRSKCLSRKIGSVLVKDDSIISAGFNGPAKSVSHCNERNIDFYLNLMSNEEKKNLDNYVLNIYDWGKYCPRRYFHYKSGQGLHLCQAGHSERNALIQAARNGISTLGTTLYCYCGRPCKDCMIEIVNSGVKTLVYLNKDNPNTTIANNSGYYDEYSGTIEKESGIIVRTIKEELI